ncbi:MAG: FAD-dependent oxidoreductase [Solirubrobacterales bacterium]|nr:FAD-dependent oxidoreductase [Solirubrobacterales bacterium]
MADRHVDVLLIGGGVASASCAAALRDGGFEGSILLAGRESDPPYNRPPASKGYLAGTETRADALYHPAGWYEANDVELLTRASAMKLDAAGMEVRLATKETVRFDQALLATGANVRRLTVDGADLDGIHYLRALGNADAIRDDVPEGGRVVLIGGSYIGSEVAATLTSIGRRCTIVMQEEHPLSTGFGDTAGRWFGELLSSRGIEIHGGEQLERMEGSGDRVQRVVLAGGAQLGADAVVLGVGAVPDVMLAKAAGLELGEHGGVRCDSRLRTSAEGIFAAGDVCQYDSVVHGRPLRVEHWDVAVQQGRTVAANMLGADRAHEAIPYFFSDLSDWVSLEYVGPASAGWDEEVVRGSLEEGAFSIWYLKDNRLAAALSVGRSGDLDDARRLIASGADVGEQAAQLRDAGSDLSAIGA